MVTATLRFRFTAVNGFFQQDYAASTNPALEATTLPGLGLIDRAYETDEGFDPRREKHPWERFAHYLDHLNEAGSGKIVYKLLYAARHGEGYHNVKEAEVGTAEWESYWAKLDGDGTITWADAQLTPRGEAQARAMRTFWADAASTLHLPLPPRHYASPLARCLDTCTLAFSDDLVLPAGVRFAPVVKELLRERLGVHTCDRRRSRTWIRESHPQFKLEEGFSEEDGLWRPDVRETLGEHAVRVEAFLEDLFGSESAPIVSVTAHSGTILALWEVIGHAEVRVAPGAIVPVLVKAEVYSEE